MSLQSLNFNTLNSNTNLIGGVYLACNETGQAETLDALANKTEPEPEKRVHFGWACEMNYKIVLQRKPRYAFICDIDHKMHRVFAQIRKLMIENAEVEDFKTQFTKFCQDREVASMTTKVLEGSTLVEHFTQDGNFLSSDNAYKLIRTMYEEGRIFHYDLDVCDPDIQVYENLRQWIGDQNCIVDTLYSSNIIEWVRQRCPKEDEERFNSNLNLLMTPGKTSYIYAEAPSPGKSPKQIITTEIPKKLVPEEDIWSDDEEFWNEENPLI